MTIFKCQIKESSESFRVQRVLEFGTPKLPNSQTPKLLVIICLSLLCNSACLAADVVDKIVVVVNDQAITSSEIENAMRPVAEELKKNYSGHQLQDRLKKTRREVIERLIEEKLILQEAKKQKIEVKNGEVEERMQQVRSKFSDRESFQKAMRLQGVNMWELKKVYKEQIMVRKMVRWHVRMHTNITPVQITEYYQKHLDEFKLPEAVRLSEILIKYKPVEESLKTQRTAKQVKELLAMGADFAFVARKYSEGPNARNGGDMGMVERGTMAKEIDDVIFTMKEQEVSDPIKTDIGFVILKVDAIRKEEYRTLEEVKGQIEELLLDENAKAVIEKWVQELKAEAYISIKE